MGNEFNDLFATGALNTPGSAQGTKYSGGIDVDFNWVYDGTVIPGWQVNPGIFVRYGLFGNTPNVNAQFMRGVTAMNLYVNFIQNPANWQVGLNYTRFMGRPTRWPTRYVTGTSWQSSHLAISEVNMNQPPVSDAARPGKLPRMLHSLENTLFGHRRLVLSLVLFTVVMACFAVKLRMDAGFEKQLGHEYTQTFNEYRGDLLGANRLIVVVKARKGSIWTPAALKRLYEVTQAVTFLPNVSRSSVQSLWTPNSFVNEITEDGFRADPLIPGTVTPDQLDGNTVGAISRSTARGGFVGSLVSRDQSSAMVTADLNELDAKGERVDYVAFDKALESQLRAKFEDANYEIQIIGFAKQIGDIANGASSVLKFCAIALLLTALAVYWYCRSVRLTILPLTCSLVSLVWQFGTLHLLGYGRPVGRAGSVPGVRDRRFTRRPADQFHRARDLAREVGGASRPVQLQRAADSRHARAGDRVCVLRHVDPDSDPDGARAAITASLGVAYKIVTNLVMLPLAASLLKVDGNYAKNAELHAVRRGRVLRVLAKVAIPRNAAIVLLAAVVVFAVAAWESRDRVVGTLQAGAPELRADARFNQDSVSIASSYDVGLDWISIVFEAPPQSCNNVEVGAYRIASSGRCVPSPAYCRSFRSRRCCGNTARDTTKAIRRCPRSPSIRTTIHRWPARWPVRPASCARTAA